MYSPATAIVLIGFMGAGKSAVGRELSRRLDLPRYDTDELIRQRFDCSIPAIFTQHGEETFRNMETEVLRIVPRRSVVVAGGGVILRQENVELLRELGRTFWLDAAEDILWSRVSLRNHRPLLHTENPHDRFRLLLQERLPRYQVAADHRIDTSCRSISEVADEVMALI